MVVNLSFTATVITLLTLSIKLTYVKIEQKKCLIIVLLNEETSLMSYYEFCSMDYTYIFQELNVDYIEQW